MNKNPIYTITTVRTPFHAGTRCVGFYHEYESALEAVIENHDNICEDGYYPYCVIELINPGIYSYDAVENWFKWNYENHSYEKTEKPYSFRTCVSFAVR